MAKTSDITGFPVFLPHEKIRISGNIIEVRSYLRQNADMPVVKIDANHYMIKATGEIIEFEKTETRAENLWWMNESKANMRAIANANFQGGKSEMFITLTYRENMQDAERLYRDFKYYRAKLERRYNLKLSYLAVAEPQERGAWHLHCLVKRLDRQRLYIPQNELMMLWGHGGVNVQRLKGVDNVGAYLSGYLAKACRLNLYKNKMHFYRCSHDLIRPDWHDIEWQEKAALRCREPQYCKTRMVQDADQVVQIVRYEQYNMIRKDQTGGMQHAE